MKRVLMRSLLVLAIGASVATVVTAAPQAQQMSQESAVGKMLFVAPVSLRGTLGEVQIQASLRTMAEMEGGIEGEYFVFGQSQQVLLAGEVEGDQVFLEESKNGTDVSGQWNGKLIGDTISGEWQSADGNATKPFTIKIVRGDAKGKRAAAAKSSSSIKQ
jgi:hypothetical protein